MKSMELSAKLNAELHKENKDFPKCYNLVKELYNWHTQEDYGDEGINGLPSFDKQISLDLLKLVDITNFNDTADGTEESIKKKVTDFIRRKIFLVVHPDKVEAGEINKAKEIFQYYSNLLDTPHLEGKFSRLPGLVRERKKRLTQLIQEETLKEINFIVRNNKVEDLKSLLESPDKTSVLKSNEQSAIKNALKFGSLDVLRELLKWQVKDLDDMNKAKKQTYGVTVVSILSLLAGPESVISTEQHDLLGHLYSRNAIGAIDNANQELVLNALIKLSATAQNDDLAIKIIQGLIKHVKNEGLRLLIDTVLQFCKKQEFKKDTAENKVGDILGSLKKKMRTPQEWNILLMSAARLNICSPFQSMHNSTPEVWADLIAEALKYDSRDVIQYLLDERSKWKVKGTYDEVAASHKMELQAIEHGAIDTLCFLINPKKPQGVTLQDVVDKIKQYRGNISSEGNVKDYRFGFLLGLMNLGKYQQFKQCYTLLALDPTKEDINRRSQLLQKMCMIIPNTLEEDSYKEVFTQLLGSENPDEQNVSIEIATATEGGTSNNALHYACMHSNIVAIKLLMQLEGAQQFQARNSKKLSPLLCALNNPNISMSDKIKIVSIFTQAGYKLQADENLAFINTIDIQPHEKELKFPTGILTQLVQIAKSQPDLVSYSKHPKCCLLSMIMYRNGPNSQEVFHTIQQIISKDTQPTHFFTKMLSRCSRLAHANYIAICKENGWQLVEQTGGWARMHTAKFEGNHPRRLGPGKEQTKIPPLVIEKEEIRIDVKKPESTEPFHVVEIKKDSTSHPVLRYVGITLAWATVGGAGSVGIFYAAQSFISVNTIPLVLELLGPQYAAIPQLMAQSFIATLASASLCALISSSSLGLKAYQDAGYEPINKELILKQGAINFLIAFGCSAIGNFGAFTLTYCILLDTTGAILAQCSITFASSLAVYPLAAWLDEKISQQSDNSVQKDA